MPQNRTKTGKPPHPKANATSFKPGQSGNEGGRPKKDRPLLDALRDVVKPVELAKELWKLVKKGDLAAIRYVYDRSEGMPTQRHELATIDDVREKARRTAEEQGLDPDELIREAEAIFRGERLS